MNSRKYPRTLQEAFGPYCSPEIEDTPTPIDWQDAVVLAGCGVACVATFIILCIWG